MSRDDIEKSIQIIEEMPIVITSYNFTDFAFDWAVATKEDCKRKFGDDSKLHYRPTPLLWLEEGKITKCGLDPVLNPSTTLKDEVDCEECLQYLNELK